MNPITIEITINDDCHKQEFSLTIPMAKVLYEELRSIFEANTTEAEQPARVDRDALLGDQNAHGDKFRNV